MRSLLRCSLVWLLALSFAVSGVAARQCAAAQQPSPVAGGVPHIEIGQGHHAHAGHQGAHAGHDHGASAHQNAPDDLLRLATDGHACSKCCGICTLAVGLAPEAGTTAIFKVSPASFPAVSEHCCGTTISVDPGIPKRIV